MMMTFVQDWGLFIALGVAVVAFACTWLVRRVARATGAVDQPGGEGSRKQHRAITPLLGGVGIYIAFAAALLATLWFVPAFTEGYLGAKQVYGILLAGAILILGGVLDDYKDLSPKVQILFPVLAALTVVSSGIGISLLTNPFGADIDLTQWKIELFTFQDEPYFFVILADLFAVAWVIVSIYATKFLDGVDGLVSGLTVISGLVLFALSLLIDAGQSETAYIALMLAAAAAGFFAWNGPFPRARIFLGEGGSTFLGFVLAVLAIISGAKIGTALLLLGLPIVDLVLVVGRRLLAGVSPFQGDRRHTHFQLMRLYGGSAKKTIATLLSFAAVFGGAAVVLVDRPKTVLVVVALFVALFVGVFVYSRKQSS